MEISKITGALNKLDYKFLFPLIYLIPVVMSFLTILIPPLNKCSGFDICFPLSMILIILLSVPGYWLINSLDFIVPRKFYTWSTYSENLLWVILMQYAATFIFLFFVGLLIDKIKQYRRRI